MSTLNRLNQELDAYLAIREAVGLSNKAQHRLLQNFLSYAEHAGVTDGSPIRAAIAMAWAWDDAPATCGVKGRAARLMVAPRLSHFSGQRRTRNRSAGLTPRSRSHPPPTLHLLRRRTGRSN